MSRDALTDPLGKWDPNNQSTAYNNFTDRVRMELPEFGDPASSGVVLDWVSAANPIKKYYDFKPAQLASGVWTPTSGKSFVVTDLIVSAAAAGVVTIYDSVSSDILVKLSMAANGIFEHSFAKPWVSSSPDNVLRCDAVAGASGFISVYGYEV